MDRFSFLPMGRRRPWVIAGMTGSLIGYISMGLVSDPINQIPLLIASGMIVSISTAFYGCCHRWDGCRHYFSRRIFQSQCFHDWWKCDRFRNHYCHSWLAVESLRYFADFISDDRGHHRTGSISTTLTRTKWRKTVPLVGRQGLHHFLKIPNEELESYREKYFESHFSANQYFPDDHRFFCMASATVYFRLICPS